MVGTGGGHAPGGRASALPHNLWGSWTTLAGVLLLSVVVGCGKGPAVPTADQVEAMIAAGRALERGLDPETSVAPKYVVALRALDADVAAGKYGKRASLLSTAHGLAVSTMREPGEPPANSGVVRDRDALADALQTGDVAKVVAVLSR